MKMKKDKLIELKRAVDSVEIVDAHSHNIVALDSNYPFLKCFSDATGDALYNAPYTLNFKRGLRELTELYGPSLSLSLGLHTVLETRRSLGLEQSAITCFRAARVSTILIDDGIELDKMVDIEWHKKVVPMVGRILRVEHLAETILQKAADGTTWTLDSFMEIFTKELKSVADNVVAFKSMVACCSGLAINTEVTQKEAEEGLSGVLCAGNPIRISNKSFIDYIFMHALEVAQSYDLPMQIHMGFGDKDFDMMLANPLYLHNLLEDKRFTNSRLVLLHASYPFSKEASHLASAYPQVYLDFGFAIPKLSFHGMISSVNELLKLAPMNKVMFSTDAIAFAEAFYLGAKRAREVVFSVLHDAMVEGDLSITKAVAAVKDIFAENAKKFYKLHKLDVSSKDSDIEPHIPSPFIKEELHGSLKDSSTDSDVEPCISSYFQNEELYGSSKDVTLVRIIWIDASGQHRCRGVPRQRFYSFVKKHGIGLPRACMGISSISDYPVEDTTLTCSGLFTIVPDLSTKCRIPWAKQQEMVLANMCTKSGEPWEYCPREALRRISKILKDEFGLVMTAGFEVEFYLLESVIKNDKEEFESSDQCRKCHTAAFDAASPMLEEMLGYLQSLNITVDYLHKEAGKGQFEIGLPYTDCFRAADTLIYTREVIRKVGRKYGFHPTFLPKYSLDEWGCGSNVHISLSKNGINVFKASEGSSQYGISKIGQAFMSGVLDHLPAILAFTAPHPTSYERLYSKDWNGRVVSWQKENNYAKISTCRLPGADVVGHFVCPAFDACANPYLGLASILTAGIDGLRKDLSLAAPVDRESRVNQEDYRRLPDCLTDSLSALEEDTLFKDMMGENLMACIKAIRKAEINHYSEDEEPYKDLIYKF
ncbi:protein fluG-like isoform X1 [Nicotiana tomentosiformis]|uniref:protein fluG-like isoform X1 n=2 Tax=Nicotiana tomentosiformis TaxID=4098 RepID=UPI00051C2D4A|nr:protein fluG-like isoform X1 [Nicotiana tomentosiformis]XP_033510781.1 protein fluG-like isoform X1 [Nicotiana tomentosiformis]